VLADEAQLHTKEVKGIAGASLPDPQRGYEVIKGTKVDLGVCQVYLNRGSLGVNYVTEPSHTLVL